MSMCEAAHAHPHVWVDSIVTAIFERGRVTALREDWWFDEEFTATALGQVRKTKGMAASAAKPLTLSEVAELRRTAFSNLAHYAYFTHLWAAGQPIEVAKEVTSFAARLDGDRLAYSFTLPLAHPVDPRQGGLRIGVWDDSYYVDVGPKEGHGAAVEGDGASSCSARIIDDKDHLIYYGSVTPKVAEIKC